MAIIRAVKGPLAGQTFQLSSQGTILGRANDAQVVLDNEAVSRQHARIYCNDAGQWILEDLKSVNGTAVNGVSLSSNGDGKRVLSQRDHIKICMFQFAFEQDDVDSTGSLVRLVDGGENLEQTSVELPSSSAEINVTENPETKLRAAMALIDSLADTIGLDQVLPKVLSNLIGVIPRAQRGFIQVRREGPEGDVEFVTVAVHPPRLSEPICISRTIVNEVLRSRQAVLSRDASHDNRFASSESVAQLRLRSLMCAPLLNSQGEVLGVIELDQLEHGRDFEAGDLQVLASIARHLGIIIENARLHERAIEEQRLKSELERIEHDLDVARRLQRGLLPKAAPNIPDYSFYSFYQPAEKVGGDFYDFIRLPGNRLAVVVADVSGEGVPAALIMARFAGDARHFLVEEPDPSEALARLNRDLIGNDLDSRYITLVAAIIDTATHAVTFVNAGHWAPLLRRADGETRAMAGDEPNFSLGWFADSKFRAFTVQLEPGDRVAMYTDGILDARNPKGEQYGPVRLHRSLAQPAVSIADQGNLILRDVQKFIGQAPQADDMCLLLFGRK